MNQKLDEIRNLYSQLNILRLDDRCYYDFRSIVDKILKLIDEQDEGQTNENKKMNFQEASSRLSYTLGKEIIRISSYQDRMHKKNARGIRRKEYEKSVEDAIQQVRIDLSPVIIV